MPLALTTRRAGRLAIGAVCAGLSALAACGRTTTPATPLTEAPTWAADAVWYQIFIERFRNGDPSNDPTAADIQPYTPQPVPANWATTPWGHDWYALDPWAKAAGMDFYGSVSFRRYGGDLQGVLDRLDYLQDLGVTALYLNPINDAPSLHKFDARSYHHIDHNLGPDPKGDQAIIAAESPADPATWRWTAADSLFLRLVREVHARDMRIIVDFSWNHTGVNFWAWQDILAKGRASAYADWYEIDAFDDPATPDTNEFRYRGWANVPSLPEWKKTGRPVGQTHGAIPGTLVEPVRRHIFAVTQRWLDPNGDGDPSDGIDGFRLDVADVVPLDFWREYRRVVRGINPEAYLVGEVWWQQWPDSLWNPDPWLQGDVFDAVMHYQWFDPTRRFLAQAEPALTATGFRAALDATRDGIRPSFQRALMNLTASHDTPRFGTAIQNRGKNKFRATPRDDAGYRIDRPDAITRERMTLILAQQFTWVGAPHIWNGDESGMWGADDPDPRKPVVWDDLAYEDEVVHPFGRPRSRDRVAPDTGLRRIYRELAALRRAHQRLFADGAVEWLRTDDAARVAVYARRLGAEAAVVALNASDVPAEIDWPDGGPWTVAWPRTDEGSSAGRSSPRDVLRIPPRGAVVLVRDTP